MQPLAGVDELRRSSSASWTDELAARDVLRAASGQIRAYCGWAISEEVEVEVVLDSNGSTVLSLPCLHVTDVHEVLVDAAAVTDYEWSQVGTLYRSQGWPRGLRRVTANYSGGYATIPAEISAVCASLAGRVSIPTGLASMTVGSQAVSFTTESGPALNPLERAVLDHYLISAA